MHVYAKKGLEGHQQVKLGIKTNSHAEYFQRLWTHVWDHTSHPSPGKHHLEYSESAIHLLSDSEKMQPQDLTLTLEHRNININTHTHTHIYKHTHTHPHTLLITVTEEGTKPTPVKVPSLVMQAMHTITSPGPCLGQWESVWNPRRQRQQERSQGSRTEHKGRAWGTVIQAGIQGATGL